MTVDDLGRDRIVAYRRGSSREQACKLPPSNSDTVTQVLPLRFFVSLSHTTLSQSVSDDHRHPSARRISEAILPCVNIAVEAVNGISSYTKNLILFLVEQPK